MFYIFCEVLAHTVHFRASISSAAHVLAPGSRACMLCTFGHQLVFSWDIRMIPSFSMLVHAVHFQAAISSAAHVLAPDSRECALLGAMSL